MSGDLSAAIEGRIDKDTLGGLAPVTLAGGAAFVPQTVPQMMEMAKMLATSRIGVRKHLRNNPGACLAVCMQSARWGMDPFAVANKSYEVNDQLAYESQLIAAVLNTRAPIKGRLRFEYEGEGAARRCTCSAVLADGHETVSVTSPTIGAITPKNSPLWKSDPDQQLAYYTSRALARRHFPEVLLGVYAEDELQDLGGGALQADGTVVHGSTAPEPPKRSDFQQGTARLTDRSEHRDRSPTRETVPVYNEFGESAGDIPLENLADRLDEMIDGAKSRTDVLAILEHNEAAISQLPQRLRTSFIETARKIERERQDENEHSAAEAAAEDPAAPDVPPLTEEGADRLAAKKSDQDEPEELTRWRMGTVTRLRRVDSVAALQDVWGEVAEEIEKREAEYGEVAGPACDRVREVFQDTAQKLDHAGAQPSMM